MSLDIVKGSTDVILYVVIRDSVTGVLETGFDVTTLDFQYTRTKAAPSVKQDVTALALTTSDHADNKAIEVDATNSPGMCRVDFPDAAFATGVDSVRLNVTGAGFDISPKEVPLVDAPATAAALTAHNANLVVVDGNVDNILADTVLVDKWLKNKLEFDGTTMTLYDDNGTDALLTWTLSSGNTTVVGPSNRAKAM